MAIDFPTSPALGNTITSGNVVWTWNGASWDAGSITLQTAGGVTVSASPPSSPNPGDKWIESGNLIEYTYISDGDSSQWVQLATSAVNDSVTVTTANVIEDINLYYTNARVYANVTQIGYATSGQISTVYNQANAAYSRANAAIDDVIIYSLLLSGM